MLKISIVKNKHNISKILIKLKIAHLFWYDDVSIQNMPI